MEPRVVEPLVDQMARVSQHIQGEREDHPVPQAPQVQAAVAAVPR